MEALEFKSDTWFSGPALGYYNITTDQINVNLECNLLGGFLELYDCMFNPPQEYCDISDLHDYLAKQFNLVMAHEWIHRLLNQIGGPQLTLSFDNLNYSLTEVN